MTRKLHLPGIKSHVHNPCTTLEFQSHEVGEKCFLEGYGTSGGGQNTQGPGCRAKECGSCPTGNAELWGTPEECSDVVSREHGQEKMDRHLVVVPRGLLTAGQQPTAQAANQPGM